MFRNSKVNLPAHFLSYQITRLRRGFMQQSRNNAKMMMQKNEKMLNMMLEDHANTVKMMKGNPALMHNIMADVMEVCNSDTSMMAGMCKTVMQNKPMMDMIQKMKTGDQGMPHKM